MLYGGFELEQEVFVFGIVAGFFDVFSGKGFDAFEVVPYRYSPEVRYVTFCLAPYFHFAVAGCSDIVFHSGFMEKLQVALCIAAAGSAVPYAGDHGAME